MGRDQQLEQAAILFGRLSQGRAERSVVLTGLRGVGKTVLLGRMRQLATDKGWLAAGFEARSEVDLRQELAEVGRQFLERIDPIARAEAAAGQVRNWIPRVTAAGGDLALELGPPAPARLEADVVGLFERLGAAARAAEVGVALFIDELQDTPLPAMTALCAAMHRASQDVTPIALVGAGLPTLPGRLAEAKSYAERLFTYPRIANLEPEPSRSLITEAVAGIELPDGQRPVVSEDAIDRMTTFADGYPMFLQAVGKHAWAIADGPDIDLHDAEAAEEAAFAELAQDLFVSRWQRATPRQRDYLAAIARAGGTARTADAARDAGFASPAAASPVREELIEKGTVYPPRRGEIAFTVPQFDRFVLDHLERTAP